jgi:hypothetical protein
MAADLAFAGHGRIQWDETFWIIYDRHFGMTDEFTRRVFRIILAKAALSRQFTAICETTVEILIDVVIDRLSDFARSAASITCHCGRTDTNGLDVFAALDRYHETPESLSTYLRRSDQLPPFDYLVDAYPLPRLPSIYSSEPVEPVPFRADSTFVSGRPGQNHIPPFFPPFPQRYTDDAADRAASVLTPAEEVRPAEGQSASIKQALGQLSVGRGADIPHTVRFGCELRELMTGDLLSRPAAVLRSPIYQVEGALGRDGPEMLPLKEAGHSMFFNAPTNDVEMILQPPSGNKRRDLP